MKELQFVINPINTMVRFLKLVAFLDHFSTILGRSQNGPKT